MIGNSGHALGKRITVGKSALNCCENHRGGDIGLITGCKVHMPRQPAGIVQALDHKSQSRQAKCMRSQQPSGQYPRIFPNRRAKPQRQQKTKCPCHPRRAEGDKAAHGFQMRIHRFGNHRVPDKFIPDGLTQRTAFAKGEFAFELAGRDLARPGAICHQ